MNLEEATQSHYDHLNPQCILSPQSHSDHLKALRSSVSGPGTRTRVQWPGECGVVVGKPMAL